MYRIAVSKIEMPHGSLNRHDWNVPNGIYLNTFDMGVYQVAHTVVQYLGDFDNMCEEGLFASEHDITQEYQDAYLQSQGHRQQNP